MKIMQGTTPALAIPIKTSDFLVSDVVKLELTFLHNGVLTMHGLDDVIVDTESNKFYYHFTEAETLALAPKKRFMYQCRFYFAGGNIVGTDIMTIDVANLLSEEVMTE